MYAITGHPSPEIQLLACSFVEGRPIKWNRQNYSAPFWRIYWTPLKNNFKVRFNGRETAGDPSYALIIPPETQFAGSCRGGLVQFVLEFRAAFPWNGIRPEIHVMPLEPMHLSMIKELISLCGPGAVMTPRLALLSMTLCQIGLLNIPPEAMPGKEIDCRILAAMRRMERTPSAPLSTAELACDAGMNINAFIRLFKSETGTTPQKHSLKVRIDYASALLTTTMMSVEEVAEASGFCDRHHFTRCFSSLRRQGPSAFRRESSNLDVHWRDG